MNRKADGGSALHAAVANKHEAVFHLLLRHGANPLVENAKGALRSAVLWCERWL